MVYYGYDQVGGMGVSTRLPSPPPGFDELSVDEKLEYIQSLWDRIANDESSVPVPEWHREVLRERLEDRRLNPDDGLDWDEVRDQLKRDLDRRGGNR